MRRNFLICYLSLLVSCLFAQTMEEGLKLYQNKKYDEARSVFESILKNDDKNAEAHYWSARLMMIPGYRNPDGAIGHMEKAVEINNGSAEYHWMLGNAYGIRAQQAGIFKAVSLVGKIKDEYKKAVELNPKEVQYRFSLIQFYVSAPGLMGGSNSKAKDQANEIVKMNPSFGHLSLAQIAVREKENALAEQEFSKAIEANPKNGDAYNSFGYFYLTQKRYDEAISKFLKYVEVAPENANSYDSLGEGYMTKGDLDAAITQFKKAIEINTKFTASIFNLAQCYEKKNMKTEALQFYQQSLNTDPQGIYSKRSEKKIKELSK